MISKDSNVHECEKCQLPCAEEEMEFFSRNGGGNIGFYFCNTCISNVEKTKAVEILGHIKMLEEDVKDYRERARFCRDRFEHLMSCTDIMRNNIESALSEFSIDYIGAARQITYT